MVSNNYHDIIRKLLQTAFNHATIFSTLISSDFTSCLTSSVLCSLFPHKVQAVQFCLMVMENHNMLNHFTFIALKGVQLWQFLSHIFPARKGTWAVNTSYLFLLIVLGYIFCSSNSVFAVVIQTPAVWLFDISQNIEKLATVRQINFCCQVPFFRGKQPEYC